MVKIVNSLAGVLLLIWTWYVVALNEHGGVSNAVYLGIILICGVFVISLSALSSVFVRRKSSAIVIYFLGPFLAVTSFSFFVVLLFLLLGEGKWQEFVVPLWWACVTVFYGICWIAGFGIAEWGSRRFSRSPMKKHQEP